MSFFDGLFGMGHKDPSKAAMPYFNNIFPQAHQYQQPFFEAGRGQLPGLQQQYAQLLGNPGEFMNNIGKNYQQSPGFKSALEQALGAGNRAAAAGGMAGSPQHEQYSQETATNAANKDYQDYLNQAMNAYGLGLHGSQGLANQGQNAGNNLSQMIQQILAQQGNLAYQGAQDQNNQNSNKWNNIFSGIGAVGGLFGL